MKKKILIAVLIVIAAAGYFTYDYVFNAQHRDIASEEATVTLTATDLFKEFSENESKATVNYLDKVIDTKGTVTLIEGTDITLDDKVQVTFLENTASSISVGNTISIKGRCVGYDELLELVKIDQANILNK